MLLRSDINLNDTWALTLEAGHAETTRDRNFSTLAINDLATGASSLSVFYQRNQRFALGFQCAGQAAQQGGTGSRRGGAKRGECIAGRTHEGVGLAGSGVLKGHGAW